MEIINEQSVIDALCLSQAYHNDLQPQDVMVELTYDDDEGFGAEVEFRDGRTVLLSHSDMIGALRAWVKDVLHLDPFSSIIELVLDDEEGIIAHVK